MLQLPGGRVMQYGKGSCNSHLSEMLPARTDSVQKGSFHSVSCQSVHSVRLQTEAASGLTYQQHGQRSKLWCPECLWLQQELAGRCRLPRKVKDSHIVPPKELTHGSHDWHQRQYDKRIDGVDEADVGRTAKRPAAAAQCCAGLSAQGASNSHRLVRQTGLEAYPVQLALLLRQHRA